MLFFLFCFVLFFSSVSFLPCLFPVLWFLQITMNKPDSGIPLVLSYISVFWSLHSGITNSSRKCNMGQEKEELKKKNGDCMKQRKNMPFKLRYLYTSLVCTCICVHCSEFKKHYTIISQIQKEIRRWINVDVLIQNWDLECKPEFLPYQQLAGRVKQLEELLDSGSTRSSC